MSGSFLGNVGASLYMGAFLLCGISIAAIWLQKEQMCVRIWLGMVMGMAGLMWLPALWALWMDFTLWAQLAALLTMLIAASVSDLIAHRKGRPTALAAVRSSLCSFRPKDHALLFCALLALVFSGYLLHNHVLRPVGGALHTGQSCFGDMSMHLGFISSLAVQHTFPPEYSISPGTALGYPFLCDSVSATLYQLGATLRYAYILPMLPALFCVFWGFGLLMRRWLGAQNKAVLAFALFFVGGGFGFAYFFDHLKNNPDQLLSIFRDFYKTPTNLIDENVRWVNPIADMMIPQRATLFGSMPY